MLLENNSTNYLQRSIDTLRSLGDRLNERNVDLRLNLHHHHHAAASGGGGGGNGAGGGGGVGLGPPPTTTTTLQDRPPLMDRNHHHHHHHPHHPHHHHPHLELNLSLNPDRLLQERTNLERLIGERGGGGGGGGLDRGANLVDHHLHLDNRLLSGGGGGSSGNNNSNNSGNLSPSERILNGDNNNGGDNNSGNNYSERVSNLNSGNNNINGGGGGGGGNNPQDMRHHPSDINNDLKFREYKTHLENLRNDSRSLEGRNNSSNNNNNNNDDDRGTTPSTPPTPISVGENFQEEKVFGSKAELQLHTQAHMREAKPYKCSQCCKAFANSSYLSQHTRIHLGIKPYRCEICQRKFTQLSHLQQHIRTHTGDKPYKCRHPGCQKAFSQLSNLQSHSRCHQTDKPYKCNSCYKCFSDEPSLLEHIPKHKESKHLKTHICQYCGKSYTQETYLSKHMQKHAERTDKRPPIGTGLGLNHRGALVDHPYWPKVSPDSAENLHDYPNDIPRQILEQNEDLVIIRQQLSQNHPHQPQPPPPPPPPGTPNLTNSYDNTSISKGATTNGTNSGNNNNSNNNNNNSNNNNNNTSSGGGTTSAFTPINSMAGHLNLNHHQLAPNRPYIYDALSFQQKNTLDLPKNQPSNGFPNQLISLHQIRNYAHQPNTSLMEHSLLGLKDK